MSRPISAKGARRNYLADRYGISTKSIRLLGDVDYLESLDELPRQVLINSLRWKPVVKRTASQVGTPIERMLYLEARRAA